MTYHDDVASILAHVAGPVPLTEHDRVVAIMRQYWNDTYAKNCPIRMFLWTGVSSGALMLGQGRQIRLRLGNDVKEIFA